MYFQYKTDNCIGGKNTIIKCYSVCCLDMAPEKSSGFRAGK